MAKYVTVMLIPDGTEARKGWRIRQWVLKTVLWSLAALLVGILLFFAFYGQVLSRAAMTDRLRAENTQLRKYRLKVQLLESRFDSMRETVNRLTALAGVDFDMTALPDDSTILAQVDREVQAVMARPGHLDWSIPVGLPLQGFMTRGFEIEDQDHYHPGVDIACGIGTPVLATGTGKVVFAGSDSTYGYMVVIAHNDSLSTIYGHNNKLLVVAGQEVVVGSRIAESGNSGISTAPHLHYEMRLNNQPINPTDNLYDKKNE